MAIKRGLYKGFSSFEFESNNTFSLNDMELVKMDLLQHIHTKRGERVMMPTFGTLIPEIVFEPLTIETVNVVREEVYRVINYDPRVSLIELGARADFDNYTITVQAKLLYVELNLVDNLELNIGFEQ